MGSFEEQLKELKRLTNTSKNVDLAKALGKSPKTISNWKHRDHIPEDIFIKARELSQNGSVAPRGYLELKFYDVEVSAGHGTLVEKEEESSAMVFSERFIRQELGFNPNNIFLMPVRGDSMAPTLKNQSIVMVNRVDGFSTDGIYVFRYDNRLMVKRLQFLPNGIKVVSDNSSYEAWELGKKDMEGADFEIIGEVVWSGQRM
ncbi:helix-turn-helix transcriptional regulator [Vibrio harveyi]|uniref:S24 family peptidase n=1 Tax=Vibrio harveyi group TaxID=717610 RepID=UPI00046EBF04|nr:MULTISPECIES: S24 family peptidase [Vibrio harveyi group]EKO3870523.1 helix-turn-helix transcriptional regulator [Vibrio harveyi]ELE7135177.1 helix-turn-helix transcriptional regulator [Vibrio harveyi]MBE3866979.1 helix-turn-helix transcriptional regulator [Vibrio parahaemolyticus]MCR9770532.1 helix-turn-helix domain-containing protein [Vibrio harveyi]MCZ5879893.1 helix-turn-helix domain-containing protein [Vibrio parahaemolyticus]